MLGFMLFAGLCRRLAAAGSAQLSAAALLLLFVARMALLTTAWAAHRTDLADLRAVLAPVQPGQAVYVAEAGLKEAPAYWAANPRWRLLSNGTRVDEHLGALALIEHRAWWPFRVRQSVAAADRDARAISCPCRTVGHLPDRAEAAVADVCGFDYVLLMDCGRGAAAASRHGSGW